MNLKILTINLVLVLFIYDNSEAQLTPIGVIFDKQSSDVQAVFRFSLEYCKKNRICRDLEVQVFVDVISTADAFKLARLVCNQFGRGIVGLMGYVNPDSFDILHSYTNTFQMPFMNPFFPERVIPPTSGLVDHAVSMRPDYHKAVLDTVKFYGWKNVIFIYDSHDGLLRLQKMYQTMQPGKSYFKITHVKRICNASEATAFLRQIEKLDRWSNKYVLLDASLTLAKQVILEHVHDVHLGRRNYHYLMTNLIMDERWERSVPEFGAINITGFRIIDLSRPKAREILNAIKESLGWETISSYCALMFDSVLVFFDSMVRFSRKRPNAFREHIDRMTTGNGSKIFECVPSKGQSIEPYESGDKILRMIGKTDMEGITGTLRFNENTQRINFTLHVIEITPERKTVKVATWSDILGLRVVRYRVRPLNLPVKIDRNRTYAVSSVLQPPYLMKESVELAEQERFVGFCKDLTEMVAQKLEITYEIRLPKDGKYGEVNTDIAGGWNGMMGEVVRKETDMIIAPMQITTERAAAVEFSKPFLSVDYRPIKKSVKSSNVFGFMNPLSWELWMCIVLSVVIVGLVLFLVSRFSPLEWRVISTEEVESVDNGDATEEPTVINDFSFWNSMWFSIGSFMQQGSDIFPRSLSGRIVSTAWWFFTMILIATYTANLASNMIFERISETPKKSNECPKRLPLTTQTKLPIEANNEIYYKPEVVSKSWFTSLLDGTFDTTTPDVQKDNTCDMVVTVSQNGLKNYAVALHKGSPLRGPVNIALQSLKDDGELEKLITRWFAKPDCEIVDENIQGNELALNQLAGVFYILLSGLLVAIIVAIWDFCRHGKAAAARANVPLRAALKAKSRAPKKPERKEENVRTPAQDSDHEHDWVEGAYGGYYSPATQLRREATALQHSFTQV